MLATDLLTDAYTRVSQTVHTVLRNATVFTLTYRADPETNTIAWLVWHLTRVQDDHVSHLAGVEQLWTSDGWSERFDLPFDSLATGYAQTAEDVAAVRADASLLQDYFDAVHERTMAYIQGLNEADFARVVDRSWSPPVTVAVRLVSVLDDDTQHAGQAAFVRGLAVRAGR
ncbi:chorismate synthase [Cryobacterium roopkundense]|uniref:Chorismate synthase n=1 Tax=Cryobacterium roopkundense TaxID=1001240 RepID=A0A099JNF3_9MICO|nr:DUF664 domain-containing protein [Cryobacterium roopkundense]KGJ79112.1 chorismate synthase [Cryobacterium roopkundense]MBB5643270.1 hypothetical protein [Cryobacterium roopkundense]